MKIIILEGMKTVHGKPSKGHIVDVAKLVESHERYVSNNEGRKFIEPYKKRLEYFKLIQSNLFKDKSY